MTRPAALTRHVAIRAALTLLATLTAATACGGGGSSSSSASGPGTRSPSPSSPATPSATADRSPSATPSGSATASPIPSSPPPTALSTGVRDVSFVSATDGWVIQRGALLATTDAGRTWTRVGAVPAGADRLRFASTSVGYAWRADQPLAVTTDGGRSWHGGGLAHVLDVEIGDGVAWALTGPLPGPQVWRAPIGSASWKQLGTAPNREATLDVHGNLAYVTGEQGAGPVAAGLTVWSSTGGSRDERLPCAQSGQLVPRNPLGVSTDGTVVLVCVVDDGSGHSRQLAYTSSDAGRTWTSIPAPPTAPSDVTADRQGALAWGRQLRMLHDGQWSVVLAPGSPFRDVGLVTDQFGVAVDRAGALFTSTDGGRSWSPSDVRG